MRVLLDLKRKNNKFILLEVDNVSFGTENIVFIFGDKSSGEILYAFNIPDDGTEVYNILSHEALEKGFLDLRGYEYHMYDIKTSEEIFEDE